MSKGVKPERVPTLTPDTLSETVFYQSEGVAKQGPYHSTFHINRIETVRQSLQFPMPPHRKTVVDFILVTHGSMVRRKGLTSYTVPANTFFLLPAHQISFDEWMSEDIRGYYCHFDTNLLTRRWQKQDLENEFSFLSFVGNPLVSIDTEKLKNIIPLLARLEAEYQRECNPTIDIFRIYLLALFFELKQTTPATASTTPDQADTAAQRLTQQYKNALSEFVYEKQNVADYAELLHISPNHLNKCVRTITGQSARDLLDEMILLEAKVLLSQTTLSISEIAYRIRRQDPSNFGRFFKTKTGMTPREYQQVD
ncbi:helix-turn-helix domain-containing protein [Spirosoma luteum]|uniref:helix-turn-helix domain-containing protein n=1 Tax=Spirosoma luteum TaxID=431553 RepID=UPI0003799B38|nr:helix-turn-helix domain-containing protein [Spirosoma luteum]